MSFNDCMVFDLPDSGKGEEGKKCTVVCVFWFGEVVAIGGLVGGLGLVLLVGDPWSGMRCI